MLHDDMTAVVRVNGGTTDEITIRSGLRQGCMYHGTSFIQSVLCSDGCLLEGSLSQGWNHCEVQDREESGRE